MVCIINHLFFISSKQLKSTNYGRLAWHHLAQVLAVIFDELQVDTSTHRFAKKLIRAGILKYLFGMKVNKAPFGDWYVI